jgi:hypothetical protein
VAFCADANESDRKWERTDVRTIVHSLDADE